MKRSAWTCPTRRSGHRSLPLGCPRGCGRLSQLSLLRAARRDGAESDPADPHRLAAGWPSRYRETSIAHLIAADDCGYELAGWSQEARCSAIPAVLLRETFGQFDAGARGIGEESGGKLKLWQDLVRRVEFDSVGGECLAEAFEVFDLECDVIDRSSGGWRYGIGMRKGKSGAANEAGIRLIVPSRSGAEDLCIPCLCVVRPRGVQVNMIELQRRVHRAVFGQFDAHAVGPVDHELVGRRLKALIACLR